MAFYESFAGVYDLFMDGVPYDAWMNNISGILLKEGIKSGIGLDLGCGTGQMTRRLSAAGYDMIGADASVAMLSIARENSGDGILYLCQDMRSFELYGTVAFAVSLCDSLNYLEDTEELTKVFSLVNNYLDPGGVFLFDMNTPHKYRDILADNTFAETRDESAFIWENDYEEETRINRYELTLFMKEKEDLFRRYEEVHLQKAFTMEEVKSSLKNAGLVLEKVYDLTAQDHDGAAGMGEYREDAERVLFFAREKGKQ